MTDPRPHPQRLQNGDDGFADVAERLRAELPGGRWLDVPVPADRDAAIRGAIRGAFPNRLPARRWSVWSTLRRVAIAAMLALVALIALHVGSRGPNADRRLVAAARLSDLAREGRGSLADPTLQALLAAIVALPVSTPSETTAGGEFVVVDLLLDPSSPMPSAWLLEVELPGLLVGIEGGDPPYDEPARYDPRALDGGVVRLAAVRGVGDETRGTRRLGSLTLRRSGDGAAVLTNASLIGPGGESLAITVRCVERTPEDSHP